MKTGDITILRNGIRNAARVAPITEVRMTISGGQFKDKAEAIAIAYDLSTKIENVDFILMGADDKEVARYINGAALNLPALPPETKPAPPRTDGRPKPPADALPGG